MLLILDAFLIITIMSNWIQMGEQERICDAPLGYTVMYYCTLLSTLVLIQPFLQLILISVSVSLNVITGFQYRAFKETIYHTLTFHTPELFCKESVVMNPDKAQNVFIARSLNTHLKERLNPPVNKLPEEIPYKPREPLRVSHLAFIKSLEVMKASETFPEEHMTC
jgi:hypothetical protein